jgi:GNAT superfamily N-acetyltransferase
MLPAIVDAAAEIRIRPAERGDSTLLLELIEELAGYEKLSDQVRGDAELLEQSLFDRGVADALIVEVEGQVAGYAIFFTTFSTFECRPGLWLEDVYVRPECRRKGVGRALLAHIAGIALARDCARIEWTALDWNEPALRFYEGLGGARIEGWQALRLEGEGLRRLAA